MEPIREHLLRIIVKSSRCEHYQPGDVIYLEGAFIGAKTTAPICMTAMSAIYPFLYAARKGLTGEQIGFPEMTFQCPDVPETVVFQVVEDDLKES